MNEKRCWVQVGGEDELGRPITLLGRDAKMLRVSPKYENPQHWRVTFYVPFTGCIERWSVYEVGANDTKLGGSDTLLMFVAKGNRLEFLLKIPIAAPKEPV